MKVLLLGGNGQLGWELRRALSPLGQVTAVTRDGYGSFRGDLSNLDGLAEVVRSLRPNVIVNAAAYTAVDRAESEAGVAEVVNTLLPKLLAEEARKLDAVLVHYSTDYVFDGSGQRPWNEADRPSPINLYGKTKLRGDLAVESGGSRYLILRTSWVYAARGRNFVRNILRLAGERETLQVIADQIGAPTGAELLADLTAHAAIDVIENPERAGTYHVTADGETTWYEYAMFIVEKARALGWPLRASGEAIEPVPSEQFPTPARRPKNCRLDCGKFSSTFGLNLPNWQDGVERVLMELSVERQIG